MLTFAVAVALATPTAGFAQQPDAAIPRAAERAAVASAGLAPRPDAAIPRAVERVAVGSSRSTWRTEVAGSVRHTEVAGLARQAEVAESARGTEVAESARRTDGAILRAAERVAAGMELQSGALRNRRSRSRTWTGMVMVTTGAVLATAVKRTEVCSGGSCTREERMYKPVAYSGVGLAVAGALLMSVWSDVPANPRIDFTVTPDRLQVGKTFGF